MALSNLITTSLIQKGTNMKKLTYVFLISTLALSSVAIAKPNPQGGFSDGSDHPMEHRQMKEKPGGLVAATTVAEAKKLTDDAWVVLTGNITKQIRKETYLFKDKTGEIEVEIGRKEWRGQAVTPKDLVEISGEVDKDWSSISIEVKSIKLVTPVK